MQSISKFSLQDTPIEDLDLTITTSGDFLRSCCVYLNGFNYKQTDKLKKIVSAAGGERMPALNDRVTHVVLANQVDSLVKERLLTMKSIPVVLTAQWLVKSFKQAKLMPVKEFLHPEFHEPPIKEDLSPAALKRYSIYHLEWSRCFKMLQYDRFLCFPG